MKNHALVDLVTARAAASLGATAACSTQPFSQTSNPPFGRINADLAERPRPMTRYRQQPLPCHTNPSWELRNTAATPPSRVVALHAMPPLCSADICAIVTDQTTGSIGVGMWLLIFFSSVRVWQSNKLLSGQCLKLEVEQ